MEIKSQDLEYSYSDEEDDSQVIESRVDQMWNKIILISKEYATNLVNLRITENSIESLKQDIEDVNALYERISSTRQQYSITLESIKQSGDNFKMDVDNKLSSREYTNLDDQHQNMVL